MVETRVAKGGGGGGEEDATGEKGGRNKMNFLRPAFPEVC